MKDIINVTELVCCCCHTVISTTWLERERVDQQNGFLKVNQFNILESHIMSHFHHSEFPRSFVNEYKANELLSVGDETLGSALLSPRQHIDSLKLN